jgi:hypothetical protein
MPVQAEADPRHTPVSPLVTAAPLLQRMESITPGPFDVNGRAVRGLPTPDGERRRHDQLTPSTISTASSGRSRSSTNSEAEGRARVAVATVAPMPTMVGIPKLERTGGYGGFGPPSAPLERPTLKPENRSQTLPMNQDSRLQPVGLPRRPSEPAMSMRRPSNLNQSASPPRQRQPPPVSSPARQRAPSFSSADRSRPLPPRGASLIRKTDPRTGAPRAMPNLEAEFGAKNPYHTPSASESSNESMSSRPSPQREDGMRRPSDTRNIDALMEDIQATMASVPTPPREQYAKPMPPLNTAFMSPPPESPMDPAFGNGRMTPHSQRPKTPVDTQRRPTNPKICKGCNQVIIGKSVSSADGRLTGRYHKQCFHCTTCHLPFATSTFYVIDDSPYCERHYHKLNNSLCQTCDKGIEGQYLETERKQKYHPSCLTCSDCRRVLRDDYFEMNSRVYCERDAFKKARERNALGVGGTNRMERRTTRLMMM